MTRLRPIAARRAAPADEQAIARRLAERDPWLRLRKPRYQLQMIADLLELLPEGPCRIIDIGAGNGLVAETLAALAPGKQPTGVDIAGNALSDLAIPFTRYDGRRLPFADGAFDCALMCNMLHHVPPTGRAALLREALRVTGGGTLIIKDHLARAPLDRLRLWALDVMGNAPRGFMIEASYLDPGQWDALFAELGCAGEILPPAAYRTGVFSWLFPNRLEIALRVSPSARPGR